MGGVIVKCTCSHMAMDSAGFLGVCVRNLEFAAGISTLRAEHTMVGRLG
jgi:hypothetical protein